MTAALITIAASIASLAAALFVAHRDDLRRQQTIDDRIAVRYRQPTTTRSWS